MDGNGRTSHLDYDIEGCQAAQVEGPVGNLGNFYHLGKTGVRLGGTGEDMGGQGRTGEKE